jgi:hypothetical protein
LPYEASGLTGRTQTKMTASNGGHNEMAAIADVLHGLLLQLIAAKQLHQERHWRSLRVR